MVDSPPALIWGEISGKTIRISSSEPVTSKRVLPCREKTETYLRKFEWRENMDFAITVIAAETA